MELICLDRDRGLIAQLNFSPRRLWIAATTLSLCFFAGAFYVGWRMADAYGITNPSTEVASWRAELETQQTLLEQTRRGMQQSVDALALRLGQMNARVVRLDALGLRLTEMAGLDDGEFDFTTPPALGGPEELVAEADQLDLRGVLGSLDGLALQLQDRSRQLDVLEEFMLNRKLADEIRPIGRPVASGYISSRFGQRTDPFTGRRAFHQGVDFAGREGADVIAVGSGVVIWSGPRQGYGELVEVNHGDGYVTRYAHNSSNLVSVGDTVKRGQIIARLGDTGRATGPNLHFEVLRNGQQVDPMTYVD
jgi:murein DD-endopeptidase MepM/ murein hydrolase activator NlpD